MAKAPDVYWGGFAFQGDFSAGERRYPLSTKLADQPSIGVSVLNEALRKHIATVRNSTYNIVIEDLGSLGPDASSSIALAFVLDRETVSVEQFGFDYKLLVELSAQALFFDFGEMSVLASYPITLQFIHVQGTSPTDADKFAIVESLYLGDLEINVFEEFAKALAAVDLNLSVSRRIQVKDVSIAPEAVEFLPEKWRQGDGDFEAALAQEFSRSLSRNQNVPVLPYTRGYAIRNSMAARFANGEVFNLELPEPDYEITLELRKFVKIEFSKVAAGTSYVYGSYLLVRAEEPLSGRTYIDSTIKNGATKVVPAGQTTVDDWPAYQDSLLGLIEKFTNVLSEPNKAWAKKHLGDSSAINELVAFSKVVLSCR